jgi:hypothetical protein
MLLIQNSVIFPAVFASQVVHNENPTVGIEGARPANSCIPPSFPGSMSVYLPPKNTFESTKNLGCKAPNCKSEYNYLATILLRYGELPNSFVWGAVLISIS